MRFLGFLKILFILSFITISFAQESGDIVLKYDDGNPNIQLMFMENGGTSFVTRFTPPSVPVVVEKIQYFIPDTADGSSFNLNILSESSNGPGEPIFGPLASYAKKIGWNEIELQSYNIITNGDFYVELAYDNISKLTIGAENREPISGRTYDKDS